MRIEPFAQPPRRGPRRGPGNTWPDITAGFSSHLCFPALCLHSSSQFTRQSLLGTSPLLSRSSLRELVGHSLGESGVRAPAEGHRTSRQLYERRSGRRFLFKRRAVIIILSYDFTSCGRTPPLWLCLFCVESGTFTFISPLSMEFNSPVFMCPQDCLQAPSVNVHTNNGGRVLSLCRCYLQPIIYLS